MPVVGVTTETPDDVMVGVGKVTILPLLTDNELPLMLSVEAGTWILYTAVEGLDIVLGALIVMVGLGAVLAAYKA